jgi:Saccharopine dehydrogenase C-terminal domain
MTLTDIGIPCAVAVQQVLNGTISEKGILAPMSSKINDPLMKELKEKYGLVLITSAAFLTKIRIELKEKVET